MNTILIMKEIKEMKEMKEMKEYGAMVYISIFIQFPLKGNVIKCYYF